MRGTAAIVIASLALAACRSQPERPAPPRVTEAPKFPLQDSTLVVPISLSLDDLQRSIEASTPRRLWSIDERHRDCVPAQRARLFGKKLKVTPDIGCRIVGEVTRGPLRIAGAGQRITLSLPVRAQVSAKDVGGVLKSETATGAAVVRADVTLGLDRAWRPRARVDISYGWTEPPGIDFLGQRIRFVRRADKELARVVAGLERDLQREIEKARVKPIAAEAWKEGFAVISLNRERPPVWMRVTPQAMGLAGYRVAGRTVTLTAAAAARVETFVGQRPDDPQPVPLPPQAPPAKSTGLRLFVPVIADYAELEPVVLRALRKLAQRGIRLEGVGHVDADFQKVTVYATGNGRLAVGIEARVEPVGDNFGTRFGKAEGRVWLTGLPVNAPDSQVIEVRELDIFGGADRMAADLLIRLIESPSVRDEIAASLTQNFERDYQRILAAARQAVAERREGGFRIAATIDEVHHDRVQATGAGLFLPVTLTGSGRIRTNLAARSR
jgi:hypothetical protein